MLAALNRYHAWMEDEWLRDMTASERLTLDEEFAMYERSAVFRTARQLVPWRTSYNLN